MKKVTIQDIAKEMGLSRNTVAKALSNGAVAPETRNAVIQKAWQMGYAKLNEDVQQELETQYKKEQSGTILVLFNRWESVFWNRTMAGISSAVTEEGFRMQLHIVDEQDEDGDGVLAQLADDVKGIIFLCVFPIRFVRGVSRAGLPMTFFNTPVNAQEYIELGDVYNLEGFYSMNKLTGYCIEKKGCRTFAFIGFAEGSRVVQARYLGFLGACNQHNIQPDERMLFTRPSNQIYFGYSMVEEVVQKMNTVPDAIICENDDIAKYTALALLQRDPELARKTVITGFDNTIEEDFFKKDIITVDVKVEELGRRLVKSVIDRVRDPRLGIVFATLSTYPKLS